MGARISTVLSFSQVHKELTLGVDGWSGCPYLVHLDTTDNPSRISEQEDVVRTRRRCPNNRTIITSALATNILLTLALFNYLMPISLQLEDTNLASALLISFNC